MSAAKTVEKILESIERRIATAAPFRAVVDSLSAGKVAIIREGSDDADTQLYARLAGFDLVAGDEVLCINLGKQAVVLGKLQRAAASGLSLPMLNFPIIKWDQSNTNFTNTDTANDADAISTTIVLPTGTWTLYGIGGTVASHSAVANQRCRISLDGTLGDETQIGSATNPIDSRVSLTAGGSKTGVTSGTKTCKMVFKSATVGTMTVDFSWIQITAVRTA